MTDKKGLPSTGASQSKGQGQLTNCNDTTIPKNNKDKSLEKTKNRNNSIANDIVKYLKKQAKFFHDKDDNGYLLSSKKSHKEVYQIGTKNCDNHIQYLFFKKHGRAVPDQAMRSASATLSSIAKFDGHEAKVFIRVGSAGENYYIDLCNKNWQIVQINSEGIKILDHSPIYFQRTNRMQSLPEPENANLQLIWKYINVEKDDEVFILAFMIEAMRHDTQFPLLELIGQQGSGKSSNADFIRALIDPNSVNLRSAPKNHEDIFVAAANNWIINYNNLSGLSHGQQDALCTLSTGGGFAGRKLYTNHEESVVEVKRPVILNGISQLVKALDLIDRVIQINVPRLKKNVPETELKRDFLKDKSMIFAGLLGLFSKALKILPEIHLDNLPRMGDFVLLGEAVSRSLSYPDNVFYNKYKAMRGNALKDTLENSKIGQTILDHFNKEGDDFIEMQLKIIIDTLDKEISGNKKIGISPKAFAQKLSRITPALKEEGIIIERHRRRNYGYPYSIRKENR